MNSSPILAVLVCSILHTGVASLLWHCFWEVRVLSKIEGSLIFSAVLSTEKVAGYAEVDATTLYINDSTSIAQQDNLPQSFLLQLQCPGNSQATVNLQYSLQSVGNSVEICHIGDSPQCKEVDSCLIDLNIISGSGCNTDLCNPAWLVPVPVSLKQSLLQVNLVSPYRWEKIRVSVPVSGFTDLHQNTASGSHACPAQHVNHLAAVSTSQVLVVSGSVLIFSQNFFRTTYMLQMSSIVSESPDSVCNCGDWAAPDVAVLHDRMIVSLQSGVYEVRGSFVQSGDFIPRSSRCVGSLCVDHVTLSQQNVYIVGICQNKNQVYSIAVNNTGNSSDITMLGASIDSCEPSNCHVKDIVAIDDGTHVLLVEKIQIGGSCIYQILQNSEGSDATSLLSTIAMDTYSSSARLQRFASGHFVSNTLYIWGDLLFVSSDKGRSWSLSSDYTSDPIVTVQVSEHSVSVLTQSGKLYVKLHISASVSLIYPNSGWEVVHEVTNHPPLPQSVSLLTLLYDQQNALQLIYQQSSSIQSHQVPLEEILSYMSAAASSPSCLLDGVSFTAVNLADFTRIQAIQQGVPLLSSRLPVFDIPSFSVYAWVVEHLVHYGKQEEEQKYKHIEEDVVKGWRESLQYRQTYMEYLHNRWGNNSVWVDLSNTYRVDSTVEEFHVLPEEIYLDMNHKFTVSIYVHLYSLTGSIPSSPQLQVHNSHPDLVTSTLSGPVTNGNVAIYELSVQDRGLYSGLSEPGKSEFSVGVSLQIPNTQCHGSHVQSIHQFTTILGCPPNRKVEFDWQASWDRLQASGNQYKPVDCVLSDPDLPCFYFEDDFYPYFQVHDTVSGRGWRYEGRYTLKAVGGGRTATDIESFTEQEVIKFNKDGECCNMIRAGDADQPKRDGFPVFSNNSNLVSWLCSMGSPCENILPAFPHTPHYFFLLQFSNRDVDDSSSHCDLTFEFLLHVHGLKVSALKTAAPTLFMSLFTFALFVTLYWACHYQNDRVLRKVKVRCQIICDRKKARRIEQEQRSMGSVSRISSLTEQCIQETTWRVITPSTVEGQSQFHEDASLEHKTSERNGDSWDKSIEIDSSRSSPVNIKL